jgi:hypothetical protein
LTLPEPNRTQNSERRANWEGRRNAEPGIGAGFAQQRCAMRLQGDAPMLELIDAMLNARKGCYRVPDLVAKIVGAHRRKHSRCNRRFSSAPYF